MAHDPSLGFADYFSAAATAAMEDGAPDLYGLHADMELLGMRGLAAAVPGGSAGPDGGATMRFLSAAAGQQQQQPCQAPLSLSLCRPDGGGVALDDEHNLGTGGSPRHHHHQAWMAMQQQQQEYSAVPQQQHVQHPGAWHLRSSRFLVPAQQLLHEFCSLPVDQTSTGKRAKQAAKQQEEDDAGDGSSSSASWAPSPQIQAMEALELQRLKDKLYIMLEEVDRRYRRYCEQMRALSGGFEVVAGERAAAAYTALASRTISRHFRSLRDGIVAQLQAVRKALGEKDVAVPGMTRGDTPRLRVLDQRIRQHKALTQAGMMESHPWRPQRGLPERAVTILRAWLFEHFLHPYPSDVDKHILARQTGLSRSQVSNWFINARVRLWKPMVEEMYVEEMKDGSSQHQDGAGAGGDPNNPSSSHASGAHEEEGDRDGGGDNNGVDRKPTRAQLLHDAGSLASVVNIGGGGASRVGVPRLVGDNFGIMDHLDFDSPYDHQQQGGFGGVSLTLGLQQHDSHDGGGGVNIAFGAPPPPAAHHGAGYLFAATGHNHQMDGHHHHVQFGGAGSIDGEAPHGQEHYRSLGAGFHLLRDLAG